MQDFKFESLERVKEATFRVQRILQNRSNMIKNNTYSAEEDNNLLTRVNELFLESYENLEKKLPAEVSQFATESFKENWKTHEAELETIFDKYRELNQAVDKLCEEIVAKDKKNKKLVFLCSFLAGVIVPLIIIVIVLLLR
jgi:uncharacterized protein YaaN involved in tellurite resistance